MKTIAITIVRCGSFKKIMQTMAARKIAAKNVMSQLRLVCSANVMH